MFDFLDLGELFASWRLYFGVAVTALLCWLSILLIPSETTQWGAVIIIGGAGVILSFRWQVWADIDK
jgi:hypothetical protein